MTVDRSAHAPTATPIDGAARFSGSRVHRVEDARLLGGRGTFVDDVRRPGMLHASFVRSPLARARIRSIDTSAARALPGVHAVFVAADLVPAYAATVPDDAAITDTPWAPLAEGDVRFVGEAVAMVVARDPYVAEDAAELVVVDYEPLAPLVDYREAEGAETLVHPSHGSNVAGVLRGGAEDLEPVFAAAAHVVEATIFQQAYCAVPMETRGLVVEYAGTTGELTVHTATQSPHEVRAACSRVVGLPEHRIRVIMRDTGGGFGQKLYARQEEMSVMLAAMQLPAPLKWVEDRRENLMAAGQSRHEHGTARMAFDGDGTIQAVDLRFVSDCGACPTPTPMSSIGLLGPLFPGPYRVPLASFDCRSVFTNTEGRTSYRGPWQFESLAREMLLDIAARELGMDPVELRRRNVLRQDDLPYTNPNGMVFDRISPLETLEDALGILDYDAFRREQAERARPVGTSVSARPRSWSRRRRASVATAPRARPSASSPPGR